MVLEFKELTGVMQDLETTSDFLISKTPLMRSDPYIQGDARNTNIPPEVKEFYENTDFREIPGERQQWVKTNFSEYKSSNEYYRSNSWCSRDGGLSNFRR